MDQVDFGKGVKAKDITCNIEKGHLFLKKNDEAKPRVDVPILSPPPPPPPPPPPLLSPLPPTSLYSSSLPSTSSPSSSPLHLTL